MKVLKFLPWMLLLGFCNPPIQEIEQVLSKPVTFEEYWYNGLAELSSYELEQARYGEIHHGTAVNVFVTEPFSRSKQVKLDDYKSAGDDRVSVLKLNMTKKFLTGIYPYSMMLSTFTPLDGSAMIKSTTSSQEWCGHTFMQLNRQDTGYRWNGFSYFESEGDLEGNMDGALTEDGLWTQIRINPARLPVGEIELLPSTFYLRLRHIEVVPQPATALLLTIDKSDYSSERHSTYSLDYGTRKLTIFFENILPFQILGWEETYLSGFGKTIELTTKAKLINTIHEKYWEKNSNADLPLREKLGLDTEN